jgi:hypothetical protein
MSHEEQLAFEIQEKFILPFFMSQDATTKMLRDKEVAAIFALAEMEREKGGRIISRNTSENIAFVAKIGYPLCLYPLGDNVFLFDGLNVQEYSLPYADIPDFKEFMDGLKSSSKKRESFASFIGENANYFAKLDVKKTLKLKALIADSGSVSELSASRHQALDSPDQFANVGLLSSSLSESKLLAATHEIAQTKSILEKELKDLNFALESLGKSCSAFHNELHDEMAAVKQEFILEIRQEESVVAPILRSLHDQYDRRIVELAKAIEKRKVPLHSEKLRLTKSKTELTKEITKYQASAKLVAGDDKEGKEQWKSKIKNAREGLSTAEKQLKSNEKTLEDLDKKKAAETQRFRAELELEIKGVRSRIVELESSRDAKVLLIKQEMEDLQNQTKFLSDQISKTVKKRETALAKFDKLHMQSFSKSLDKAFIYLPFYIIAYDKEGKSRYLIIPSSKLNEMGISIKLKGALGGSKLKFFLSPQFKELSVLKENIRNLINNNSVFAAEVKRLGIENNILSKAWNSDEIKKGLFDLKEQGWLSDKEYGATIASAKTRLKN